MHINTKIHTQQSKFYTRYHKETLLKCVYKKDKNIFLKFHPSCLNNKTTEGIFCFFISKLNFLSVKERPKEYCEFILDLNIGDILILN